MRVAGTVEIVGSPHLVATDNEAVEVALLDGFEILRSLELKVFLDERVFRLIL